MIVIDFESRSKIDLKTVGVYKYTLHPSTLPLCMAYKVGSAKTKIWLPGDSFPFARNFESIIEAHNANFERNFWNNIMVPVFEWPQVPLERWRCSMAKVSLFALPRKLEKVAAVLKTTHQKDMTRHRAMMYLAKPHKIHRQDEYKFKNDSKKFEITNIYCMGDVNTEYEVSAHFPALSPSELALYQLDQRMNDRGIYIDLPTVKSAIIILEELTDEKNSRLFDITEGEIKTSGQTVKIREWIDDNDSIIIPDLQKDTVLEYLAMDNLPKRTREILEIRQLLSKTSTKKLLAMKKRVCADGRVRDNVEYYGADRTGRHAGRGMQVQNFPKDTPPDQDTLLDIIRSGDLETLQILGNPSEIISHCLRGMLTAAPGKILRCADFASIEARVLAWISDCKRSLRIFKTGGDPYIDMAAPIYNVKRLEVTKAQRDIGKRAVLGCGYQMGGLKFQAIVKSYTGIILSFDFCQAVVKTYRETYPEIPRFWKLMNAAAINTVQTGKSHTVRDLRFGMRKGVLHLKLPSGRCLSYQDPKIMYAYPPWGGPSKLPKVTYMEVDSQTRQWIRNDTYGGKLTENATQAIARDFMCASMLRVDSVSEYDILMPVHDEVLAECDPEFESLEHFVGLMKGPSPQWGKDCPIEAEGWEGLRYHK